MRFIKFFYNVSFSLFGLGYLPFFLGRLRQEKDKKRLIKERLGFFSPEFIKRVEGKKVIWLHAVSVGEVLAAGPLVAKLEKELPDWTVALSTVTPTGQAVARDLYKETPVFYLPFDWSGAVKRTLSQIRPSLILLMETELWPNLILNAWESKIPVVVVNGRVSAHSFRRYLSVRSLFQWILRKVSFFLVQSQWDMDRLQEMGVNSQAIMITGNLKFDVSQTDLEGEAGRLRARSGWNSDEKILIGGSTHEGEEKILLSAFKKLRDEFPELRLILAPRHVTRSAGVADLVRDFSLEYRFASSNDSRSAHSRLRPRACPGPQPQYSPATAAGAPPSGRAAGGDATPKGAVKNTERSRPLTDSMAVEWPSALPAGRQEARSLDDVLILDTMGELKKWYSLADAVFVGGSLVKHGGQNPIEPARFKKPILFGPHVHNFQWVYDQMAAMKAGFRVYNEMELCSFLRQILADPNVGRQFGERAFEWVKTLQGASERNAAWIKTFLEQETRARRTMEDPVGAVR